MKFEKGIKVQYQGLQGKIKFIGTSYITICMRSFSCKSRDVDVLIFKEQWKDIQSCGDYGQRH